MKRLRQLVAASAAALWGAGCGTAVFLGDLPGEPPGPAPKADGGDAGAFDAGTADAGPTDAGLRVGPVLFVVPSAELAFGKVAYFAGASPASSATRKLALSNAGVLSLPLGPDSTLKLGLAGAKPYATVRALNAQTSALELQVGEPPLMGPNSYQPAVGLAPQEATQLPVKLVPSSVGLKAFEVTLLSNDSAAPRRRIVVTAEVLTLPPCQYAVRPAEVDFGLLTPPAHVDLEVTLTNTAKSPGQVCLVSEVELASSSDDLFSLPEVPSATRELLPEESMRVRVRAWAQGPLPSNLVLAQGALSFRVSAPVANQRSLPLRALVGPGCLVVAPDERDYGTVKVGCASATRTFSVYNACPSSMTVTGLEAQEPGGQPAGGPACPGGTACPVFFLAAAPSFPDGGVSMDAGAAPLVFGVTYRPIAAGDDRGAIAVRALQGGQEVRYLTTLRGAGAAAGLNTDVFLQDTRPEADLLLVVDNSGSMQDKRQALADNFAAFFSYATRAGVDYHLAVTTTDMGPGGEQGSAKAGMGWVCGSPTRL